MTTDLSLFGQSGLDQAAHLLQVVAAYGWPEGFDCQGVHLAGDLTVPRIVLTNTAGEIMYLDEFDAPQVEGLESDEEIGSYSIYTTDGGVDLEHAHHLVDDHHGIYMAQLFMAEYQYRIVEGMPSDEDLAIILDGPDNENYVEAWADSIDRIVIELEGKRYTLYEDSGLYAVPVETTPEELAESEGDSTGTPEREYFISGGRRHWVDPTTGTRHSDGNID